MILQFYVSFTHPWPINILIFNVYNDHKKYIKYSEKISYCFFLGTIFHRFNAKHSKRKFKKGRKNYINDRLSGSSLACMVVSDCSNFSIESPASASALASFEESQSTKPQGFRLFFHKRTKAKFQKRFEYYQANKCKLTWLPVNCRSVRKKVAERQASCTLEYLVRKFSRITTMYLGKIELLTTIEAYVRP